VLTRAAWCVWDFLAGDAPGLFFGAAAIVALVGILVVLGARVAAEIATPPLVVLLLTLSAWRGRRGN
jgi:hypothetical protein